MTVTTTKPTYESLKRKEEELEAQLKEVREEIAKAETDIIVEKLSTAIQYLKDVDEMTTGYYRCTVTTYCEGCEQDIDIDVTLTEIIEALQQLGQENEKMMNYELYDEIKCPKCKESFTCIEDLSTEATMEKIKIEYSGYCDECESYFRWDMVYKFESISSITEESEEEDDD